MQPLVGLTQFLKVGCEEGLVLDSLSRTQGRKSVQPHIDADSDWPFHRDSIRDFYLQRDKPPIRRFRDPCACHAAFETQILRHVVPSEFGDPDAMIAQLELIVGKVEARFVSPFAFEVWAMPS